MNNKVLSFYDWFLIAGVIASNIIYSALSGNVDIVGSVAGIAGVLCVVLVAKGNIWNYLFGIINVSMYAYISYKAALYGDAALNALYYVPMQFIGWWQWRKRGAALSEAETGSAYVQVLVCALLAPIADYLIPNLWVGVADMHILTLGLNVVSTLAVVPHRHVLTLRRIIETVVPFCESMTIGIGSAGLMTHPPRPVAEVPVSADTLTERGNEFLWGDIIA
jgi:nicotinamide mononucleotide transporter PnuC